MKRPLLFSIHALALGALFASIPAGASDWMHWRGPNYNGTSPEKSWTTDWPKEGPKQLWKASVGTGFSSFAVAQGRVYTVGNTADTDTLFCLDAKTGKEIWAYKYPCKLDALYYEGGPGGTPTLEGKEVYFLSKRGDLLCLDAATGHEKWIKNIATEVAAKMPTWGYAGSVLVQGTNLIVNVGSHGVAVEKATGKVVWKTGGDEAGYATPVPVRLNNKPAVAIFAKDSLVAVEAKDGKELWSTSWKTQYDVNAADPIFNGERVFLSSGYGTGGGVIDFHGGKPVVVWKSKTMHTQFGPCVLVNGYLYGISGNAGGDADLRCVEFSTGELKWKEASPKYGAMIVVDGKLVVIGEKGELIIAEATPEAFKPLARAQVLGGKCWTAPVLSDGRLFVRNAKGDVVCLDVSAK